MYGTPRRLLTAKYLYCNRRVNCRRDIIIISRAIRNTTRGRERRASIIFNPINDIIFFVCARRMDTAHIPSNRQIVFIIFNSPPVLRSRPFARVVYYICPINRTRFNETIILWQRTILTVHDDDDDDDDSDESDDDSIFLYARLYTSYRYFLNRIRCMYKII